MNTQYPQDGNSEPTKVNPTQSKSAWKQPLAYLTLLLIGGGMGLGGSQFITRAANPNPTLGQSLTASIPQTKAIAQLPITDGNVNFVSRVVQNVGPAVVRINATKTVKSQVPEVFQDPIFRQFFGSQIPIEPQERQVRGAGSGFIINQGGQILTNAHVVDGADTVTVTLKDGREFEGKVMGSDPVTDVAVVKIEANNLPTVRLGNADQLQPGEWAIAIGNPLGLDNTVTVGIISATGRNSSQIGVPDKRVSFIQTDAAINPGNSGGPLLNQQGEVIGMNTAIIQGAQGLGFAIPINTAQRIADQLVATGQVKHPFLGIQMVTLTPELQKQINRDPNSGLSVTETQGVLVVKVLPNSPAGQAGIRSGDVIVKMGDRPVTDANSVQQVVESTPVGTSLSMELRRNGQTVNLNVKPGAFPNQQDS